MTSNEYQSPIDIIPTEVADLPAIELNYIQIPMTILNNGHTIKITYSNGHSNMSVNSKIYQLLQFHFHIPSEHAIYSKKYDMEVHFVHKHADGDIAVLAAMITSGNHHPEIQKIWDKMPMQQADPKTYLDITLDATKLLPNNLAYYLLQGSLTTPPYTEGLTWHVLHDPIEISSEQIAQFRQDFTMNARPLQPTNGRRIVAGSNCI